MNSTYAWIITKNHIEGQEKSVVGPRDAGDNFIKHLNESMGETFKMFDDDGELCYVGRIIGDYDGFEPLDDFGMPNAGCTYIQYKQDGKWETL